MILVCPICDGQPHGRQNALQYSELTRMSDATVEGSSDYLATAYRRVGME